MMRTAFFTLIGSALAALAAAQTPFKLSNTLGNNMVLQRDSPRTLIWGFGAPAATVVTTFNAQTYNGTIGADGVWRQALPSTPAGGPYAINVTASTGETVGLINVMFGDVYICGGGKYWNWSHHTDPHFAGCA